jgi:DNA-binding NarL/FixJ family response regulator
MTRVLLIDDHRSFRDAVGYLIDGQSDMRVAGSAGSLAEALPFLDETDVALVDLGLDHENGLDVVKEISTRRRGQTSIVVLTASRRQIDFALAVANGAAGMLHKSVNIDDILATIRRLASGEAILSPAEMVELLRLAGQQRTRDWEAQGRISQLTKRELAVLEALSQGLSDKSIADQLNISHETVRSHMVNILGKLGVDSRLQAVLFAVRNGVVSVEPGPVK